MLTWRKLSQLWRDERVPRLDLEGKKYAIVSDLHMGDGRSADDFRENEGSLEEALEYYEREGFELVLLGDIEELWQFDLEKIVRRYRDTVYARIKAFGDERVHRVFGNHDIEWACPPDPAKNDPVISTCAHEALILNDCLGEPRILLVHGHQGSTESDKHSWLSRFFVRLFKGLEPMAKFAGLYGHPSATKSQVTKGYERVLYAWAKESKVILICGHSHRAIFASRSWTDRLAEEIAELQAEILANRTHKDLVKRLIREIEKLDRELREERLKGREIDPTDPDHEPLPCYFNSGCALYTDGLTAIEIDSGEIRLVKWHREPTRSPRREIYQHGNLESYITQTIR